MVSASLVLLKSLICAHFFSAIGYSDGYQLKTSLKTLINDDLGRRWLLAFISAEVGIVYKIESKA